MVLDEGNERSLFLAYHLIGQGKQEVDQGLLILVVDVNEGLVAFSVGDVDLAEVSLTVLEFNRLFPDRLATVVEVGASEFHIVKSRDLEGPAHVSPVVPRVFITTVFQFRRKGEALLAPPTYG